jgi:hypothetical protein
MRQRDKNIIDALHRFKCMTRDQIADLFFGHTKYKIEGANKVLKRLRRDGYIQALTDIQPYIYFPSPSTIRLTSQKAQHYLAIVDFYRRLLMYKYPTLFTVEPKITEKGGPEPDAFMLWQGAPWFIEMQCSVYSEKMMKEKIKRYEQYYLSEKWKPKRQHFGHVWIVTEKEYAVSSKYFHIFQSRDVHAFMEKMTAVQK